jgi:hypothetical protein
MLMPIVVAEPPAAICGGLNTQASPAGIPEQLYVTAPLKVPAPTGVNVIEVVAVCPAWTDASASDPGRPTSVLTVSRSSGDAWVSVPSVPWMVKSKTPVVEFASVTLNPVPELVGTSEAGWNVQVPGLPVVQERLTVLL